MADEISQLAVTLTADITQFKAGFDKAGALASTSFLAIEKRVADAASNIGGSMGKVPDIVSQAFGQLGNINIPGLDTVESHLASFGISVQTASRAGAFAIGTLALAMQGFSIGEFLKSVTSANSELAQMAGTAKTLNITTDEIQQLGFAMKTLGGLDLDKGSASALTFFEKVADEARNGSGDITKLFQSNGLSITDASGKLRDFNSLLDDASRLIANAGDEVDKIKIASILGLSKEWVAVLEKGPAALQKSKAAAQEAGAVIDKELVQKATEFDQWWGRSFNSLTTKAKAAAVEIASAFKGAFDKANDPNLLADTLDRLKKEQARFDDPATNAPGADGFFNNLAIYSVQKRLNDAESAARAKIAADLATNRASGAGDQIGASQGAYGALVAPVSGAQSQARDLTINKLPTNASTKIPKSDDGSSDKLNQLDKAEKAIVKETTALGAQAAALNKTQMEGAKAEAEFKLITAAQQAGVAVTGEVKQKIDELSQSYANAKVKLEEMKLSQSESKDLQEAFGSSLIDMTKGALSGVDGLRQAFTSLLSTIEDAALKAAFLGQGPLAGIFGTGTIENSGIGGIVGALFGGIGKHADGGEISGPGTGRSDSILTRVSDGEFITNAAAVKRPGVLPMLHAINSGALPRYADGGLIGSANVPTIAASSRSAGPTFHMPITVNASGGTQAQNADLARQVSAQTEAAMRRVVVSELQKQMRPGNLLNHN